MTSSPDPKLLFGIIALQLGFCRREQLLAATRVWLADKARPIDDILIEQGSLREDDRDLLAPLVARHLENHDGDPRASLAALSETGSVADELRSLGDDATIEATLSLVSKGRTVGLQDETLVQDSRVASAESPAVDDGSDSRFHILHSHAKGGLGEVYVARDTELNRQVALKEIQARYADDEASRQRFLLEAEVTGGLEHPGIVPVYGLGRYDDGRPFYAMRFIKGDSLQEATDRFHGRVAPEHGANGNGAAIDSRVAPVDFLSLEFRMLLGRFVDVCQAIEYAHSRGVLHRDLKPGNIMLGKYGETLVVDWGLAKAQDHDGDQPPRGEVALRPMSSSGSIPTMIGSAIGTPAFMPPEQATGEIDRLGPASDVYSLGATLYYMLTGRPPFQGSITTILADVRAGHYPAPREIRPAIPRPLEAVCHKAMMVSPEDRYRSPAELAEDIERYLADEPVSVFAEPLLVRLRRWTRKHQALVAGSAAIVFATIVALSVFSSIVSGKNAQLTDLNDTLDSRNTELTQLNETLDSRNDELDEKNSELVVANQRAGAAAAAARASESRERAQRDRAEEALYLSDVRLASAYLEDGRHADAHARLLGHFPLLESTDRRGWEWYYLLGRSEPSLNSWTASPANVPSIAWNGNGTQLATVQWGGQGAVIWSAKDGQAVNVIPEGDTIKRGIDWHPDTGLLAWGAAVNDAQVRIFDSEARTLTRLQEDTGSLVCTRWSPDGKRLAVGAIKIDHLPQANTLVVWEKNDGQWQTLGKKRTAGGSGVDDVQWSPSGSELLVVGRYAKTWIMDPATLEVLRESNESNLCAAAWHPTLPLLACGTRTGEVLILHSDTMEVEDRFAGHLGDVNSVAWSPNGKFLASGSADRSVKIWTGDDFQLVSRFIGHRGIVNQVRWHPDSSQVASCGFDGRVNIWPRQQAAAPSAFPSREEFFDGNLKNRHRFAWLDDKTIRASRTPKQVVDRDVLTGEIRNRIDFTSGFWRLMSPNYAYRFSAPDKGIAVRSLEGDESDESPILQGRYLWANASAEHLVAYCKRPPQSITASGPFYVRDVKSDHEIRLGKQPLTMISEVHWSPDQRWVSAVGGGVPTDGGTDRYAGWIHLFDADSGKPVKRARIGHSRILGSSMAFSPESNTLVAGNQDGFCQLYELPSLNTVLARRLHRLAVQSLSWHPTEARIVSGSTDRTVKVWDAQSGDVYLTFTLEHPVTQVAWSPGGRSVAAMDDTGVIHVWDADSGLELGNAKQLRQQVHSQLGEDILSSLRSNDFRTALDLGQTLVRMDDDLAWRDGFHVMLVAALHEDEPTASLCVKRLIADQANSDNVMATYYSAWSATLVPDLLENYETAIQMAHRVLATDPRDQQFQVCLGALLLRAGHDRDARRRLQTALKAEDKQKGSPAFLPYFLAMCESRAGNHETARGYLVEADRLCEQELATNPVWFRILTLRILRDEAHDLADKAAGS